MSKEHYDPNCKGCKPVLIDPDTGQLMADDSLEMKVVNQIWETSTPAEREAFHNVTCLNSTKPEDLSGGQRIADLITAGLRVLKELTRKPAS